MSVRTLLCVLALFLAAGTAEARFTDYLDDFEEAVLVRRSMFAPDPERAKDVKQLDKVLKLLAKPNLVNGYAKEVKAASKIAKILEKKLPDEKGLGFGLALVGESYRADLDQARAVLTAVAITKKHGKLLKKAIKCFEKADLAETTSKKLKKLAGPAKGLAEWIGAEMPTEATWVVRQLLIADEGLDLDDDGEPDNGLKALLAEVGQDGDALIAGLMADAESVALIQMWDVEDWAGDTGINGGILNGMDTDGNPKDNFSGSEPFDVTASVDVDGRPYIRETFDLSPDGAFEVTWTGHELTLGGITLPATTVVMVEGTAGLSEASGTIGVSIPVDLLLEMVVGDNPLAIAVAKITYGRFFDLDEGNAISAAFTFESVPAKTFTD